MTDKVLQAIEKSIEKWDGIIEGKKIDEGPRNCALCQMFLDEDHTCVDCPVKLYGDSIPGPSFFGCDNTPYPDFVDHWDYLSNEKASELIKDKEYVRLAKVERKFLKEVLKWYKKNQKK